MRIAVCQIVSTPDPLANLELVADGVRRASESGAELAVFPEATMACFGTELRSVAEPLDGPWAREVRALADQAGVAVVAGMFTPATDGRVANTLLIAGGGGSTHYDKIHLYDAFGFAESSTVAPGDTPCTLQLGATTIGLTTCYDIRFPGLYTSLAEQGASVILVAASWGAGVGKREQWELLVRARALDATSWIVACDQADPCSAGYQPNGTAPTGIGYSSVATPLGQLHAQLGPSPEVLIVDVDQGQVEQTRRSVPVLANRRL